MTVYNEFPWLPWKFSTIPQGYWKDMKNQRNFMKKLSDELKIEKMEDWYNVSHKVLLVTPNIRYHNMK